MYDTTCDTYKYFRWKIRTISREKRKILKAERRDERRARRLRRRRKREKAREKRRQREKKEKKDDSESPSTTEEATRADSQQEKDEGNKSDTEIHESEGKDLGKDLIQQVDDGAYGSEIGAHNTLTESENFKSEGLKITDQKREVIKDVKREITKTEEEDDKTRVKCSEYGDSVCDDRLSKCENVNTGCGGKMMCTRDYKIESTGESCDVKIKSEPVEMFRNEMSAAGDKSGDDVTQVKQEVQDQQESKETPVDYQPSKCEEITSEEIKSEEIKSEEIKSGEIKSEETGDESNLLFKSLLDIFIFINFLFFCLILLFSSSSSSL